MNRSNRQLGFTLTEMLVVIGIIVVVAILAVPVFRTMTGSRSTEAAQNQLAGILGRARAEAIGLQTIHGVMFLRDRNSQRVQAVMVQEAQRPTLVPTGKIPADVYLDVVPDRDPVLMPDGVGIQMIDNCTLTAGALTPTDPTDDVRGDDAYIGINSVLINDITLKYGGVVLFDGYGRVVDKRYAFKFFKEVPGGTNEYTNLAKLLEVTRTIATVVDFYPSINLRSQFGFVIYDQTVFTDQGYNDGDPTIDGTIDAGVYTDSLTEGIRTKEAQEEHWLDSNGVPVLVNRNNGTLVKGE